MLAGGCHLNLLAHYTCYWCTMSSPRSLLAECVTTLSFYGIKHDCDHELKMLSCPEHGD